MTPKASEGLKKRFYQVKHEYLCVSDVNEFVYMQGNNIRTKFVQNINNVSKAWQQIQLKNFLNISGVTHATSRLETDVFLQSRFQAFVGV